MSGLRSYFILDPMIWLYTFLIVAGAAVLLIPGLPLVKIAVLSQVVNGVVLPFVLIFMLLLTNDRDRSVFDEHCVASRGVLPARVGPGGSA